MSKQKRRQKLKDHRKKNKKASSDSYISTESESYSSSSSDEEYTQSLLESINYYNKTNEESTKKTVIKESREQKKMGKQTLMRVKNVEKFCKQCDLQPMICGTLVKKTRDIEELFKNMEFDLYYIKSGTTGHTFMAVHKHNKSIRYAVKVCAYIKKDGYGGMKSSKRPENTELKLLSLLSDFVKGMKSPHFIIPCACFNTHIETFINMNLQLNTNSKESKSYDKFVQRYYAGRFEKMVSVLISEWADGGDLLDYIRNNYADATTETFKVIFFHILYTLTCIHKKYPSFRHNDLKPNNILLKETPPQENPNIRRYSYTVDNCIFKIPDIGFQAIIWDFDFGSIESVAENNKVNHDWAKEDLNVSKKKNHYYDIHYFFNTFSCKYFFPQFRDSVDNEVKEFIRRVVPKKYSGVRETGYVHKGGRFKYEREVTTPIKLLKYDPFFDDFRYHE